jgi:hypothetical protein
MSTHQPLAGRPPRPPSSAPWRASAARPRHRAPGPGRRRGCPPQRRQPPGQHDLHRRRRARARHPPPCRSDRAGPQPRRRHPGGHHPPLVGVGAIHPSGPDRRRPHRHRRPPLGTLGVTRCAVDERVTVPAGMRVRVTTSTGDLVGTDLAVSSLDAHATRRVDHRLVHPATPPASRPGSTPAACGWPSPPPPTRSTPPSQPTLDTSPSRSPATPPRPDRSRPTSPAATSRSFAGRSASRSSARSWMKRLRSKPTGGTGHRPAT